MQAQGGAVNDRFARAEAGKPALGLATRQASALPASEDRVAANSSVPVGDIQIAGDELPP